MSSADEDTDATISDPGEFSDAGLSSADEIVDAEVSSRSRSELLFLARKLYQYQDKEYIIEQSEDLASVLNEEYTLHQISCSVCQQHDSDFYEGQTVLVGTLIKDCKFCHILQKCQQKFANNRRLMRIHFLQSKVDLQICFRDVSSQYECEDVHVQLYSQETHVQHDGFRYAQAICESAGSDASIRIMKNWIDRCRMTHQHAESKQGWKPTRLIQLAKGEEESAKLYSPKASVDFAALSYRWGPGKHSQTTKANLAKRREKLETSDFPKTLQDAILVTKKLGLEYLWIDRICIVQDDKEDWAHEASLMADVYESAYVVLSATATKDCKDGFLKTREKPLVIPYTHIDPWTRKTSNRKVHARQIGSHHCQRSAPKTNYILFQRGWCMQERFLARRVVHFLPDEILFECQDGRECECGAACKENEVSGDYTTLAYNSFQRMRYLPDEYRRPFGLDWLDIIREYSKMVLTYGEDSLPALSGLAARVEHLKPGKYIAGLWQRDIAFQMGWYLDPNSSMRRWNHLGNVDVLGPTFSWSSHAQPIRNEGLLTPRAICTLKRSVVSLATPNPYGRVRYASLCFSGRMVTGEEVGSKITMRSSLGYAGGVRLDSNLEYSTAADDPNYGPHKSVVKRITRKSVICFGLYSYKVLGSGRIDALLLKLIKPGAEVYVRIGVFTGLDEAWFNEYAVTRVITIV